MAGLIVAAMVGVLAVLGWAGSNSSNGPSDSRPAGNPSNGPSESRAAGNPPTGWVEHRPASAGYKVAFPGTPKSMTQDVQTPAGPVAYRAAMVIARDRGYIAGYTDYGPDQIGPDAEATLDGVRDGQLMGSRLRQEERVTVDGAPGRRISFHKSGQAVSSLLVLKDRTLYQVIYVGPPGTEQSSEARQFLESFGLVAR